MPDDSPASRSRADTSERGRPERKHTVVAVEPAPPLESVFLLSMTRFNELSVRSFEQAARYGYDTAGDMLELAIQQMRAAAAARDVSGWMSRQTELTAGFLGRQAQRTNDWVRQAASSQARPTG